MRKLIGIKTKLQVALQVMVKHRGQILGAIGISILLVMVIAVVEVMASYSRYAAIIDARLADRSLLYPAGIYAAPCRRPACNIRRRSCPPITKNSILH
jgi:hypothetical protein